MEVVRHDQAEVPGRPAADGERWVTTTLSAPAPALAALHASLRPGPGGGVGLGDPSLDPHVVVTCAAPAMLRGLLDAAAFAAVRTLLLGEVDPGVPWHVEIVAGEVRATLPPHRVAVTDARRRLATEPSAIRGPRLREASRAVATLATTPRRLGEGWREVARHLGGATPSGDFVVGAFAIALGAGGAAGRIEFATHDDRAVTRVWLGAQAAAAILVAGVDAPAALSPAPVWRGDRWEIELASWLPDLARVRAALHLLSQIQLDDRPPYR